MQRRGPLVAIGLLLVLWAIVTVGARPLTPWIQGIAEGVEVALGLDLMLGPRDKDSKSEAGGQDPEPEKK